MDAIRHDARFLLKKRDIGNGVGREVHVFVRNGRVVALLHYRGIKGESDEQRVEADHIGVVEHLAEFLEVFDEAED